MHGSPNSWNPAAECTSHLLSAVLCELGASGPSARAQQGVATCPVLRSAVLLPTAKQLIFAAHTWLEAPDACHLLPSVIPRFEPVGGGGGDGLFCFFPNNTSNGNTFLPFKSQLKQQYLLLLLPI